MKKQAVIFDMDGVLIDSEPFWRQSQIELLADFGVTITAKECEEETMGLRIDALISHWYNKYQLQGPGIEASVNDLVSKVAHHVTESGEAKQGVYDALKIISEKGYKIGLATSSPLRLVEAVLTRLKIAEYFEVTHSADDEEFGKPHPAVYIKTAQRLGFTPKECIAIEDSFNGLLAAKSATMKTIVIPEHTNSANPKFSIADLQLNSLSELTDLHLS